MNISIKSIIYRGHCSGLNPCFVGSLTTFLTNYNTFHQQVYLANSIYNIFFELKLSIKNCMKENKYKLLNLSVLLVMDKHNKPKRSNIISQRKVR